VKLFGQTAETAGRIHFVGIGGIGMSGLAEVLHGAGFQVQGSDAATNSNVRRLQQLGVEVFTGHAAGQIQGAARVVVSSAIQPENPEVKAARAAEIPVIHRADMLAEIMKNYHTVAVAGTHGKTSTTGLVWAALRAAGVDAGVINGGFLHDLGTNAVLPTSAKGWLVVEADESDRSFTRLPCDVAVVLNVEAEHMENYAGGESELFKDFQKFMENSSSKYSNIVCADTTPPMWHVGAFTYGEKTGVDMQVTHVRCAGWQTHFKVNGAEDVMVNLPGRHYAHNAAAALAVVQVLGGDVRKAAAGLADFGGVLRRFTRVGTFQGATVVDDYGHHPTEIRATIAAAKVLTNGRVVAVVQPHRYSRLGALMEDFATCTAAADSTLVLPVYGAGEAPVNGVNSEVLAGKIPGAQLVANEDALRQALAGLTQADDLVLCLGAGDITAMAKRLCHG
jgi:UDP-N-acetylmuramate--alanine ligase